MITTYLTNNVDHNIYHNLTNPWALDVGNIVWSKLGENPEEVVLKRINRVYKTDNDGYLRMIWPEHDLYRFGLVAIKADGPGNSNGDPLIYKNENQEPFDNNDLFYPNKPVQSNGHYVKYTIYTTPGKISQLRFYIRSCNYRYTRMVPGAYEGDNYDSIQITGNFLKYDKIERYSPNPTSGDTGKEYDTDYVLYITQEHNPSPINKRLGNIVIKQYDDKEINSADLGFTGNMIEIDIIQLPDYIDTKGNDSIDKVNYNLKWYTDFSYKEEIKNDNKYPEIDFSGGTQRVYFTLIGQGDGISGQPYEIGYLEYPYLNEYLSDLTVIPIPLNNRDTTVYNFVKVGNVQCLRPGHFYCDLTFDENINAAEENGEVTIDEITLPSQINPEATSFTFNFKILEKSSFNSRLVKIGLRINQNKKYKIFDDKNTVELTQSGNNTNHVITKDYCYQGTYNFVGEKGEISDISNISFKYNGGNTVSCTVELNTNNLPKPTYKIVFPQITDVNNNPIKYIVATGQQIKFRFSVEESRTNNPNKKEIIFNISGYSDNPKYADKFVSTNINATQAPYLNGYTKQITSNLIKSDLVLSRIPGITTAKSNFISEVCEYLITIPDNPIITSDIGTIEDVSFYTYSNNRYVPFNGALPGYSTGGGVYYIGWKIKNGDRPSSPRRITIDLSVWQCNNNPVELIYSTSIAQLGTALLDSADNDITNAIGFTLEMDNGNYSISLNQNIYDTTLKKYITTIYYNDNPNPINQDTLIEGAPYNIININNLGYSPNEKCSILEFQCGCSLKGNSNPRLVNFKISHTLYGTIGAFISQEGKDNLGYGTTPTDPYDYKNTISLELTGDSLSDIDNLQTKLEYNPSIKTFYYKIFGENTRFRNTTITGDYFYNFGTNFGSSLNIPAYPPIVIESAGESRILKAIMTEMVESQTINDIDIQGRIIWKRTSADIITTNTYNIPIPYTGPTSKPADISNYSFKIEDSGINLLNILKNDTTGTIEGQVDILPNNTTEIQERKVILFNGIRNIFSWEFQIKSKDTSTYTFELRSNEVVTLYNNITSSEDITSFIYSSDGEGNLVEYSMNSDVKIDGDDSVTLDGDISINLPNFKSTPGPLTEIKMTFPKVKLSNNSSNTKKTFTYTLTQKDSNKVILISIIIPRWVPNIEESTIIPQIPDGEIDILQ